MQYRNFKTYRARAIAAFMLIATSTASATAPTATTAPASPPAWPNLREVIVVFKTHFDIGYTDLARNVVQQYSTTMIDKALDVCDSTRDLPPAQQFVWTLSGWPLAQILYPEQTPERRERVLTAMRDGRLAWHALGATTHTESLELEDIVRGMRYSSELSRSLGMPLPRDAKMTDVPSHCWALPTILTHAGIEFMHIGCNGASTPPTTPPLFWWEAPDGSRIMTMLLLGYGTGLLPPKDWPHSTWLALIHSGDNHGPPPPAEVTKLIQMADEQLPGVKIRMGRLSDFADAIRAEGADLPVVRADMTDTWIHGLMSKPIYTGLARRVRPHIAHLEILNSQLACWGIGVPAIQDTIDQAYEQSFLYGEHTWGLFVKQFPRLYGKEWEEARAKGTYARLEESWEEHSSYSRKVAELVEPALADHVQALANGVNVRGPRIVVHNPLPWSRSDVVFVQLPTGFSSGVRDLSTNLQARAHRTKDGKLTFFASDVPSHGYKTFVLTPEVESAVTAVADEPLFVDESTGVLDNGILRVKVDAGRGGIISLVDKRTGRELVPPQGQALGSYLYQQFDSDDADRFLGQYNPHGKRPWVDEDFGKPGMPPASQAARRSESPSGMTLRMEAGAVFARAVLSAPADGERLPHDVELAFTLYRGLSHVDVAWTVKDKKPTPWPEAGWLCLPAAMDSPVFRLGRLGAIIDPARDLQPAGNTQVFCLNTGMTMNGLNGPGLGLCPLDSPLVSLGQPGLWRFEPTFTPRQATVYVNLFNNQWATNFDQWCDGTWTSRVRLWLTEGTEDDASLVTSAWEARSPLLAALAGGEPGKLEPMAAGLTLSRPGVLVSTFGHNPDGEGTLLRVWEQTGQGGNCRITLPKGAAFTHVRACDLRGQWKNEAVPIQEGTFDANVPRFGPASYVLTKSR